MFPNDLHYRIHQNDHTERLNRSAVLRQFKPSVRRPKGRLRSLLALLFL